MKVGDIIIAKTTVVCLFEKGRKYHIIDLNICENGLIVLKPIDSEGRNLVLYKQFAFDNFEKVIDKNNDEVKMNFMEAMNYLMKDKNNIVIGNRGSSLYKIDGDDLWENPSLNWSDVGWCKSNCEFKIYKEEKLYSFVEMMEYITLDKHKDKPVYFTSVDDPDTRVVRYIGYDSIYFDEDCGDIPISCYLGKWRRIK